VCGHQILHTGVFALLRAPVERFDGDDSFELGLTRIVCAQADVRPPRGRLEDGGRTCPGSLGSADMKCLIVYYLGGRWYGEEVAWKRSGSGTYREISRIEVPQSKAEIEAFARENNYAIEWRGEFPRQSQSA